MLHKFESFSVDKIGSNVFQGKDSFAWIALSFYFSRENEDFHPALRLEVGVKYNDSDTVRDIHERALLEAKDLISSAAKLLSENDLNHLRKISADSEAS